MLRILVALALLTTPALVAAQSPAVERALALADDYDDDSARAALNEGCDAGDSEACLVLLADLALSYNDDDQAAGRTMAASRCEGGDMLACVTLARLADQGRGGDIDEPLQRASLVSACRGGLISACTHAANLAEQGRGGPQDMALAREMAGKGCAADHALSCSYAGQYLLTAGWDAEGEAQQTASWQQARRAFTKGCELGSTEACSSLANMLKEGRGGDVDRAGAAALMEARCQIDYYQCEEYLRILKP